jgi:hypothetical protein
MSSPPAVNTAVLFYHRLREIVAARIEDESPLQDEIEIDERYFGGRREGKRGRGAVGEGHRALRERAPSCARSAPAAS